MMRAIFFLLVAMCFVSSDAVAAPRIAVFPLSGGAADEVREKVGFAIRAKFARDGACEPIDGPTMAELAGEKPPTLDAVPAELAKLVAHEKPAILIWGELTGGTATSVTGATLRLKFLNLRQPDSRPIDITRALPAPTDLRFAVEDIVQTVAGVGPVRRPNEQVVVDDDMSRALWEKNPNLLANGDFAAAGGWTARDELRNYVISPGKDLPAVDRIGICTPAAASGEKSNPVLAMNISRESAENAGMGCLSGAFPIKPGRRYRVGLRYKSDGPTSLVFVKGYVMVDDPRAGRIERECFRTQVPPLPPTDGQWRTLVADVNPYHPAFEVQSLRVDLFGYLSPGVVMWDDIVVKEIGDLTKKPKDDAIDLPITRPTGEK